MLVLRLHLVKINDANTYLTVLLCIKICYNKLSIDECFCEVIRSL